MYTHMHVCAYSHVTTYMQIHMCPHMCKHSTHASHTHWKLGKLIPIFWRLRHENQDFKTSLGYVAKQGVRNEKEFNSEKAELES